VIPAISVADHLFVLVFAVAYPILGYVSFRRLLARIAAGKPIPSRPRLYANTLALQWLLFIGGGLLWFGQSRSAESLGLGLELDAGFLVALLLTVAGIALFVRQLVALHGATLNDLESVERAFGRLKPLLPRSRVELRVFYAVGLTAGIVEEVLWRGFLLAYVAALTSLPLAAVAVTLGFGLAHAYQGWGSVPKVTAAGAVFMLLVLLSGSLWLAMLLHAAVDILQGRLAYVVLSQSGNTPDSA